MSFKIKRLTNKWLLIDKERNYMNTKKKIAITGGTGKTGRYVVSEFLNHGYEVINIDIDISPDAPGIPVAGPLGEFRPAAAQVCRLVS